MCATHIDVQHTELCLPGNADVLVAAYQPTGVTVGFGNFTRKTNAQQS